MVQGLLKKGNDVATHWLHEAVPLLSRPAARRPFVSASASSDVSGRFRSHPRFWMPEEVVLGVLRVLRGENAVAVAPNRV